MRSAFSMASRSEAARFRDNWPGDASTNSDHRPEVRGCRLDGWGGDRNAPDPDKAAMRVSTRIGTQPAPLP
jgi:hypothetical protein